MMELEIQTMQPGERLYAYRQSTQLEGQTGGIGRDVYKRQAKGLGSLTERNITRLGR